MQTNPIYGMPALLTISTALMLLVGGCDHQDERPDYLSKSLEEVARPQSTATPPAPSDRSAGSTNASTSPIGITVDRDKIIIDTRQTRAFFESLAHKLDSSFKRLEHDLNRTRTPAPNPVGITVTNDRIEIDLNKTERYMQQWIKGMERVGREMDGLFRQLDRALQ
jgi:hypothetical protein